MKKKKIYRIECLNNFERAILYVDSTKMETYEDILLFYAKLRAYENRRVLSNLGINRLKVVKKLLRIKNDEQKTK